MQIDFHHAGTYTIARFAGFDHETAQIIGHAAQYVDDATNSGAINFDNKAMYNRISSAHKMMDYRNFEALANHWVWIPFHFLPGNGGQPAGKNPDGSFIEKIICRPNSHVAQDMVRMCIREKDRSYGVHRLGVTMHVYADTWAHQGFAGVNHEVNNISVLDDDDKPSKHWLKKVTTTFGDLFDRASSKLVGDALPLGHGAVLSYPDRPYLTWSYVNHKGEKVYRNNPETFMEASHEMCKAMQRWLLNDPDADVPGLKKKDADDIRDLIDSITDSDGHKRHEKWLKKLAEGHFSFGKAEVPYIEKGKGSWKYEALKTVAKKDRGDEIFKYDPKFLNSNWKHFHDAIQAHRFDVIHDILPKYGICAA